MKIKVILNKILDLLEDEKDILVVHGWAFVQSQNKHFSFAISKGDCKQTPLPFLEIGSVTFNETMEVTLKEELPATITSRLVKEEELKKAESKEALIQSKKLENGLLKL